MKRIERRLVKLKQMERPPKTPQTKPDQCGSHEKKCHCCVHAPFSGKIDLVQDLKHEYKAANRTTDAHNKRQLFWTKIAAGMVIATSFFTGWQALLTRTVIYDDRERFVKQQAPYIWVTPKPPLIKGGEKIAWDVSYSNYGQSPALNIKVCDAVLVGPIMSAGGPTDPAVAEAECIASKEGARGPAPPGFPGFFSAFGREITDQEAIDMSKTSYATVVEGVILYDDSSGHSYQSIFCSTRLGTGAIAYCDKYNGIKRVK